MCKFSKTRPRPAAALPPFTYILELMTRSQQWRSWLSCQSVALDSRVVSSILTEGLGLATGLGRVLENLHTRKISLSFTYMVNCLLLNLNRRKTQKSVSEPQKGVEPTTFSSQGRSRWWGRGGRP